jgi:hypothetical protein
LIGDRYRDSFVALEIGLLRKGWRDKILRTKIEQIGLGILACLRFFLLSYQYFEAGAVICSWGRQISIISQTAGNLNNRCRKR